MRIARFDITAFGHFTGTRLVFRSSECDFHVIHGPNEAGKSTLRQALLDCFYGIHGQTPYDFKHHYTKLELGALIEDPTLGTLDLKRFKRLKGALVDASGAPVADADLARWLQRTDRESYQRMFAIDHEQLVAGEAAIRAADTDIRRILFSAASGLGNVGELRAKIEAEAEDLWGLRKRNTHLFTQAEARLTAAKKRLAEVTLSSAKWQEAKLGMEAAQSAEAAVELELKGLRKRQRQIERVIRVATPLARWREATAKRGALGTPVPFPDDAFTIFDAADTVLKEAKVRRELAERGITTNKGLRGAITLTPALSEHAEVIAEFVGERKLVASAERDLPGVSDELQGVEESIARGARALLWSDATPAAVAAKLPSSIERAEVEGHLRRHADLAFKVEGAQHEHLMKQAEVTRLTNLIKGAPEVEELPALADAIGEAQTLNWVRANADADEAIRKADAACSKARKGLAYWDGSDEDLASPLFPTAAEAALLLNDRSKLQGECSNAEEQFGRDKTDFEHAESALKAHMRDRSAVTQDSVREQRQQRDRLWGDIRGGVTPLDDGAEPFEAAMLGADTAADRRYDDAAFVEKRNQLEATQAERRINRDATQERVERLKGKLTALETRWEQRLARAPGGIYVPLEEYAAWDKARCAVLAAVEAVTEAKRAKEALGALATEASDKLRAACELAQSPSSAKDLPTVLAHAVGVQKARTEARGALVGWRNDLAQQEGLRDSAKTALDEAEAKLARWDERRTELFAKAALAPDLGNDAAEEALRVLSALAQALGRESDLSKRVRKMKAQIEGFDEQARKLIAACASDLTGKPAAEVATNLDARLREEERLVARDRDLQTAIGKAEEDLGKIAEEEMRAKANIAPLLALAKAESAEDLRPAIELWRACVQADAAIADAREAVINSGDGLAFDALVAEARAEDLTALPAERDALKLTVGEAEGRQTKAVEVRSKAEDALNAYAGQDDAVCAEAERQDALLLMREAAEGYFLQAMAAKLLSWATGRYAEREHEPLLKRASAIFEQLTLGSYERLVLGQESDEPQLVAYRPDGSHVVFGRDLSTGTEAQLYLAVRLAFLQQHIEAGSVLPFLGDDLMMGWDEERVAAGMRVLADLARKTQVILLTHSATVAQIAIETLGNVVNITTLPRNLAKAA